MNQPLAYLNGEMIPQDHAVLPVFDMGIVLGATVTEMVRTFGHELFRLDEHLSRLRRSMNYVGFDTGLSVHDWRGICSELVDHNAALLDDDDDLGLVLFVTAGRIPTYAGHVAGSVESHPTVCAHTFPLAFEVWDESLKTGLHLVTPSIRHVPPQCYDPKMKYRSRMHYYLADRQARLVDPQAAALLLDLDGNVTETGGANFLILFDGEVVSPTLRNILPGVSRQVVREICAEIGLDFVERDIQLHDVLNAEEAFVATTPYCLCSVTRVNGQQISDGQPGTLVDRLFTEWNELAGLDIRRQVQTRAAIRRASTTPAPTPN